MANSLAILAAVQAGSRLLLGGDQLLAQKVRNKTILLNSSAQITMGLGLASDQVSWSDLTIPIDDETQGFHAWLQEAGLWLLDGQGRYLTPSDFFSQAENDEAQSGKILQSYVIFLARSGEDGASAPSLKDGLLAIPEIPQFFADGDDTREIPAALQFGLLLIDVAATYLAINPHALDLDETGGILVQAFAANIENAVDPLDPSVSSGRLGARLFGVVLKAGLKVAHEHGNLVVAQEHAQALVKAVTTPLLETMEGASLADELKWEKVLDTFAGPVFTGTLEVLVAHQGEVFGNNLDADKAAGALANAVLKTLANQGTLQEAFSPGAVLAIYKSALGVVVERPELIVDDADAFMRDLISELAGTLQKHETFTVDDGGTVLVAPDGLGPALAVASLTALSGHAASLLRLSPHIPLEKAAATALDYVLVGFQAGLDDGANLQDFFQQDTLIELVRIFVAQAAETPEMLVEGDGTASEELKVVVSGIAAAMAADDDLLILGKDGWLQVTEVALGLAARNPGRLFGLELTDPRQELASVALTTLLNSAKDTLTQGRKNGGVLFGDTMKQAMTDTLEMIASDPDKAALAFGLDVGSANVVAEMITQISLVVSLSGSQKRYLMGSGEWLALYRHALSDLFSSLGVEVSAPGNLHVTCKPTENDALPLCTNLPNHRLKFVDLVERSSPARLTSAGEKFIDRYIA